MKNRVYMLIIISVIFAAALFGLYKRQTYTDYSGMPDYMNNFAVAQLPESMVATECEKLKEALPDAPIILKVHAVEPLENLFKISRQKVQIDEIYKGTDLSVGETIYIIFNRWRLNTTVEPGSVERGFVNVLKENEEYLIFLSEKVEPLYEENAPIYRLVEEGVIAPIFSYEEHENIIAELGEYEYSTYVRYEKVKDNEFFTVTEAGMETMLSLKRKMLEVYP